MIPLDILLGDVTEMSVPFEDLSSLSFSVSFSCLASLVSPSPSPFPSSCSVSLWFPLGALVWLFI
jgi:hypothetical protein